LKKHRLLAIALLSIISIRSFSQWNEKALKSVPLQNLDFFKPAASNWKIEGKANALRDINLNMSTSPGAGVLVNRNTATEKDNLFTKEEFGDIDFQFDFMMPKGSNSGVYFLGRYEIQLFDSWKKEHPAFSDCGGVYQRWNTERGKGNEGYEGVAPQSNESKAPGLWQTLKISFVAPRFDSSGKKTSNAKFEGVWLNGVKIHTNVEVSGPTRGAAFTNEVQKGPIMFQGDHGPLAIRNIMMSPVGNPEILWKSLSYKSYQGQLTSIDQYEKQPILQQGNATLLNAKDAGTDDEFMLHYSGVFQVQTSGQYDFIFDVNGKSRVLIDGKLQLDTTVGGFWWQRRDFKMDLETGEHSIDIKYIKKNPKSKGAMGFYYSGPGIKQKRLHAEASMSSNLSGGQMVLNKEAEPYIQRSFLLHKGIKKAYGLNVCNPSGTHFTINVSTGKLLRMWRNNRFGDITTMWVDRGSQQNFYPAGAAIELNDGALFGFGQTADIYPDTLTEEMGFKYTGYTEKAGSQPVFHYKTNTGKCDNRILPTTSGLMQDFQMMNETKSNGPIWHCLAEGNTIEKLSDGSYLIDDQYYLIIQKELETMAKLMTVNKKQRLIGQFPIKDGKGEIKYEIIW
jgi:hypothetical protein